MKKLVIFRGPSGSGKTTAAEAYTKANGGSFFEADSFFVTANGVYEFDAQKLGRAHSDCQRRVREAMQRGDETVVVSNTSMTKWELNPYLAMAAELGYEVKVFRIKQPWDAEVFAARNKHSVPVFVVQRQISKYQPLENEEEYA